MKKVLHIDQMHREIWIPEHPKRIISLVPSQTEFLIDAGIGNRLIGRTLFCIHPKEIVSSLPSVGGTKKLQLDRIRELQPDLIIGNKEENLQDEIELLEKEFPVWMSDIIEPDHAINMMQSLGQILQLQASVNEMTVEIAASIQRIKKTPYRFSGKRVAYAIWKDPWMFAGKNTFIHHMLELAGFINVVTDERYPEIDPSVLLELQPDAILLSSEPFPFKGKHFEAAKTIFPTQNLVLTDGEMFSWYGSRMRGFEKYLIALESTFSA